MISPVSVRERLFMPLLGTLLAKSFHSCFELESTWSSLILFGSVFSLLGNSALSSPSSVKRSLQRAVRVEVDPQLLPDKPVKVEEEARAEVGDPPSRITWERQVWNRTSRAVRSPAWRWTRGRSCPWAASSPPRCSSRPARCPAPPSHCCSPPRSWSLQTGDLPRAPARAWQDKPQTLCSKCET